MKKTGAIMLIFAIIAGILSGCGVSGNQTTAGSSHKAGKYQIVCTIFPEYDWVRSVIGDSSDKFDVQLLLDNGTDVHNYQPTVDDIVKISNSDVFIYAGGESEDWVRDALENAVNPDMHVINLLKLLADTLEEEEVVEGMTDSHAGHDHHHEDEEEDEREYDEHVWLSLENAKKCVEEISCVLGKVDSEHAEDFQKNADDYIGQLQDLEKEYQNMVAKADKDTILVADRFPFRYLMEECGLKYYAAFSGCSAETEASFETITYLMEKVDSLNLGTVLVIENSDHSLAETIVANTRDKNQKILVLNSLQSLTRKEIQNGVTYLSIMRDNLQVLEEALK